MRQDIPVEYRDGRSSYRATFGPVYLEYSDLLLRRASADPGRAMPLIREARDTIEQLKETELQDFPGYLRHQFYRKKAFDRHDRAGHRRDLSDCAARPARAPGQLW